MSDDFSNHPKSLAEVRSDRSQDGSDWTPRDALIATLRQIDSGEIAPTMLIVSYATVDPKTPNIANSSYVAATPNPLLTLGLMSRVTGMIIGDMEAQDR